VGDETRRFASRPAGYFDGRGRNRFQGDPVNIKHLTPFVVTAVLAVTAMSACGSDDNTPATPGSGVVTTPTVGGADTTTPTATT
jgi:hypothetical protein